jgi:pyrimidine-nucleoside phosphorylase
VKECLDIMAGKPLMSGNRDLYEDTRELTLLLAAEMFIAGGVSSDPKDAYQKAEELLLSGAALKLFETMVEFQGGSLVQFACEAPHSVDVCAPENGYINGFEVEALGLASLQLGAGRKVSSDKIDPLVGIQVHKKIGDQIREGEAVFTLYYTNEEQKESALPYMEKSFWWSQVQRPGPNLVETILR